MAPLTSATTFAILSTLACGVVADSTCGVSSDGCAADEVTMLQGMRTMKSLSTETATSGQADLEWCAMQCGAQGYCCNDPSRGSNQMISCAQACMMRASGQSTASMLADNGGICNRAGNSGCSLTVMGQAYSFCQSCTDLQPHCPHGVQSSAECDFGASLVPPSLQEDLWTPVLGSENGERVKCNNNIDLVYVDDQLACQQHAIDNGHPFYSFRHNRVNQGHKCMSSAHCDDHLTERTNEWHIYSSPQTTDGCLTSNSFEGENPTTHQPDPDALAAVRCCGDDGTCQTQDLPGSVMGPVYNVDGAAVGHTQACINEVTFQEAEAICLHAGRRLCSVAELHDGRCCGTGCWHDHRAIWTAL